ncbi:MAG: hypothetical protein M5U19_21375 [Microthrixaceae bacterium]|nr:hypothetical protein [Microthrixaceae bacterium]
MSFLLDPPLLVASGVLIENVLPEEHRDLAEAATMSTFIGISIALYLEVPGLGLFWKPFGSTDGRDFMINSGVLKVNTDEAGWRTHAASAAIYATYPLFMKLGRRIGARLATRSVHATPTPG